MPYLLADVQRIAVQRFNSFRFPAVGPEGGSARRPYMRAADDLLLTKPDQGETENNQNELSPQKTEDSD